MKDEIRSANIVVPCANFNESLKFFTERLGLRVEMIFPADAPSVAVVSGYGIALRLEKSEEIQSLTLQLTGDFGGEDSEIYSPDGVRVCLINESSAIKIPDIKQEFVISKLESESAWGEGRAGMLYRDLIPSRLGGGFVASHISIPEGGEVPDYVHFHKVRFQMIYCISGWAKLVYEDQGEPFLINAGDCVLQPPEIRHRVLETSAEFEVLEVGCPAIHETYADHALDLPNIKPNAEKTYGEQRFLHHISEKAVWQNSEIEGFAERDTKIGEATNGLADVRLFRAVDDAKFSVNHSDEFLFFFIVKGNLRLSDDEKNSYLLKSRESFVLPRGKNYLVEAGKNLEIVRVILAGSRN